MRRLLWDNRLKTTARVLYRNRRLKLVRIEYPWIGGFRAWVSAETFEQRFSTNLWTRILSG